MTIKRGGIYLATLDPVIGKEISKTRPKDSKVKGDQIRILDKSRLIQFIGILDQGVFRK
jgi:mRNA-degrading endonuclease toxin of MazEF toxin-antitoxin module